MPYEITGPHMTAALLCERVLMEADGVPTVVRVIDRITINGTAAEMQPTALPVALFIAFKSGAFRGRSSVKLLTTTPAGVELPAIEFPVNFEGDDDRGINIVANMNFAVQEDGLYWLSVLLENQPVTRVPLRILYQRIGPVQAAT